MNPKLVSVVMPCLNAGAYLREAVESVLGQELPPSWQLELVLIDDGSSDAFTLELIAGFRVDPRVRVYVNDKPQGVSRARNQAIAVAQGFLIAFHDADDRWEPEHLAVHIELLQATGAAFSASDYSYIDGAGQVVATHCIWTNRRKMSRLQGALGDGESACFTAPADLFITACPAWIGTVVVRREALMDPSPHPFNEALRLAEDLELWIRLALRHDFAFTRRQTARYRRVGSSLTNSTGAARLAFITGSMYDDLAKRDEFSAHVGAIHQAAGAQYLSAAYEFKLQGQRRRALECLVSAARCLPGDLRPYRQLLTLALPNRNRLSSKPAPETRA